MIYTELTKKAIRVAYDAHAGQVDKAGLPYVFHPYHVAEQMHDEISTCVALLHDVAEDTAVTLDMLKREFPPAVTDAVALLTHDKSVPYADYVRRLRCDPIAVAVKRADIAHNTDWTRLEGTGISEAGLDALKRKYAEALAILDGTL